MWATLLTAALRLYGPYSDIHKACHGSNRAVGCEASPSDPLYCWQWLCISVITANGSSYCLQTQGGSTRQAFIATAVQRWKQLVRVCITPRGYWGLPPPQTHLPLFPNSEWQKSFIVCWLGKRGSLNMFTTTNLTWTLNLTCVLFVFEKRKMHRWKIMLLVSAQQTKRKSNDSRSANATTC